MRWVRGRAYRPGSKHANKPFSFAVASSAHLVYYLLSFFFLFGLVLGTIFSVHADDQGAGTLSAFVFFEYYPADFRSVLS